MTGGWGALLRAVPSNAGHLFIRAFGGPPFPQHQPWARLIFNGTTCTCQSATLHNVFDFGFGQAASGATYPALYAQGWNAAETQMATWRSIDTTASTIGTFQELTSTNPDGGTFGDGWLDSMGPSGAVAASMDTYGLVVTGTMSDRAIRAFPNEKASGCSRAAPGVDWDSSRENRLYWDEWHRERTADAAV